MSETIESKTNKFRIWIRKNWGVVLTVVLIIERAASLITGYGGTSFVFAIKSGAGKAEIVLDDRCIDSLDQIDLHDMSTFKPKKPKYFVVHTTGSKGDQTKSNLQKTFSERFTNGKPSYHSAVNFQGEIYVFAEIDESPFLEWDEMVNGVRNMNSICISVAITGGRDNLEMTDKQLNTVRYLFLKYKMQFPDLILTTHREIASIDANKNGIIDPRERVKECPRFDARDFF